MEVGVADVDAEVAEFYQAEGGVQVCTVGAVVTSVETELFAVQRDAGTDLTSAGILPTENPSPGRHEPDG